MGDVGSQYLNTGILLPLRAVAVPEELADLS